jgi:hypothetical protein
MADDYVGVATPDDEDEKLLKRFGGYPPPSPINPAATDAAPAPAPVSSAPAPAPAGGASPYPAPMPSPVPGSTEDLEARADQPRRAISEMTTPAPAPPQWKDFVPPEPHGWSKLGHILARFTPASYDLNIAPEVRARQAYNAATNEFKENQGVGAEESREDLEKAQTEEANARADFLKHGGVKPGVTPEETTIHDLMTGENGQPRVNPQTGKPYSYLEAYSATMQAKQDTKPDPAVKDKQQDISDYLSANKLGDTPANREKARKAIADRGKTEPGNFMPLYDEHGKVAGAWDPKSGRVINQPSLPGNTAQGNAQNEHQQAALDKKLEPLQGVLDEIAESREYAATPSATNDYGLLMNFIGVTKPESLAKLRLNQNEVGLATKTRGTLGDIQALLQKVQNGQMLTPDQRKDMLDTMATVEKFTQRRMDAVKGGGGNQNAGGGEGSGAGAVEYKPGLVRNGYKFKGGDPTDKNNWEKVEEKKK